MNKMRVPVRDFKGTRVSVTVGMLIAGVRHGYISHFDPNDDSLMLYRSEENGSSGASSPVDEIPFEEVAFVAISGQGHKASLSIDSSSEPIEVDLHLRGKRVFSVMVDPEMLRDPRGTYAWPIDPTDVHSAYFFFNHAISGRERRERLGSMMVRDGLMDDSKLREGVQIQMAQRNAPIGQILMEQEVVKREDIDLAAKRQIVQAKRGRPMRLGEILVEAGLATEEDIRLALLEQRKRKGKRLGEVLVELGFVDEMDVVKTLAKKFHLPYVDLDEVELMLLASGHPPPK